MGTRLSVPLMRTLTDAVNLAVWIARLIEYLTPRRRSGLPWCKFSATGTVVAALVASIEPTRQQAPSLLSLLVVSTRGFHCLALDIDTDAAITIAVLVVIGNVRPPILINSPPLALLARPHDKLEFSVLIRSWS